MLMIANFALLYTVTVTVAGIQLCMDSTVIKYREYRENELINYI